MAREAALSPSQVRRNGRWEPIRRETGIDRRPPPPLPSAPSRLSDHIAALRRNPLPNIHEDKALSLRSVSTISLSFSSVPPYLPSAWSHSTEHLIVIRPSPQLQLFQSVSGSSTEGAYLSRSRRCRAPITPESYVPSGIPLVEVPTMDEISDSPTRGTENVLESKGTSMDVDEGLPREAIAELFSRVEEYEQQHPEKIEDGGKVWVRVNSVSNNLTKTIKNVGSLPKKRSSDPRLSRGFSSRFSPIRSQIKIYEKPTRIKRVKITVHDCWRKFRNWSTRRDTELQARRRIINPTPFMNVSTASLPLSDVPATRPQTGRRKLSRGPRVGHRVDYTAVAGPARKDSKFSIGEQLKRRKSSLFLDTYPSDSSTYGQ